MREKRLMQNRNSNLMRNLEQVNIMMLNLLDSHDTHRFFSEVGCDKDKLLAALALEMIFVGTPCIYYGTEICMEGGYDPDSRRCFDWDDSHWDKAVFEKIKVLIAMKKEKVLQYGDIQIVEENYMLVVRRRWKEASMTLWINETDSEKEIVFSQNDMQRSILIENGLNPVNKSAEGTVCNRDNLLLKSKGFVVIKEIGGQI